MFLAHIYGTAGKRLHGGLPVDPGVEQDQAVDAVEGNAKTALLRATKRPEVALPVGGESRRLARRHYELTISEQPLRAGVVR